MNEYSEPRQMSESRRELNCGSADSAPDAVRGNECGGGRPPAGPMSKRGLHLRLVASGLAEMDQPETRYCPDEMELTGFIERTLDERGHERVRLHVRTCSHCRELLDEVAITMAADPQKEVRRIQRRKRLHELVDVARKCFGGIRELAAELGCDPSHVYPDDGDPGLVYECVLAKALGWTHDALAEFADEPLPETSPRDGHSTFDELDSAFKLHFLNGRNEQASSLPGVPAPTPRPPNSAP